METSSSTWWHHQNGNIFCVTGPLWVESTGHQLIPLTKASNAELWCYFDLCPNNQLSKQLKCRWFEMPSHSLWYHCNVHSHIPWFYMENTIKFLDMAVFWQCFKFTHLLLRCPHSWWHHFGGLVQDCSISSALAMEILQSCSKQLTWSIVNHSKLRTIPDNSISLWMQVLVEND